MILKNLLRVSFFSFLFFGLMTPAIAGKATNDVKETTDKILALLSDPKLKSPDKLADRRRMIRKEVDKRFDWSELSRRSLARHWRKRTPEERKEFIVLFGKLVERTYMDKIESYTGEKIYYVGESIEGDYGVVKVKIVTRKNQEYLIHYRVKNKDNNWLVYDMSAEGVSLVNNYRVQFRDILRKSSYQELVERLKEKIAEE
ncbi:MAG: ABC transporter substrate-binding protein [Thermodesulfobacteriota bacterium]|nr:ABC transporter substrate-binding protein [Thermodesulfobacteriota bacterium]